MKRTESISCWVFFFVRGLCGIRGHRPLAEVIMEKFRQYPTLLFVFICSFSPCSLFFAAKRGRRIVKTEEKFTIYFFQKDKQNHKTTKRQTTKPPPPPPQQMDEQEKVTAVELYNAIAKGERQIIAICPLSHTKTTPLLPSVFCIEDLMNEYFSFLSENKERMGEEEEEEKKEEETTFPSWLRYEYGSWQEEPTIFCYTLSPTLPSPSSPSLTPEETTFWKKFYSIFPHFQHQTKFLLGGFPSFLSLFPGICPLPPPHPPPPSDILFPACILSPKEGENGKGGLFLGSSAHLQAATLSSLNVQTIVNCTKNIPFLSPSSSFSPSSHRVPVDDYENENIAAFFPEMTSIIHQALQQNPTKNNNKNETKQQKQGAVFVHCSRGASRSVSIILAYLICYHGFTYEGALDFVRDGRPEASPNPGFIAQLKEFQREFGR